MVASCVASGQVVLARKANQEGGILEKLVVPLLDSVHLFRYHDHVHNSTSVESVLNQMNPLIIFPPCFCKIHYPPVCARSPMWSLLFRFCKYDCVCISHVS